MEKKYFSAELRGALRISENPKLSSAYLSLSTCKYFVLTGK